MLLAFSGNSFTSVGNAFFEKYILTIDWNSQIVYLQPTKKSQSTAFKSYGFSYSYKPQEQILYVSFLYKNSPATRAGLKIGDQICTINGTDLTRVSEQKYCRIFFNPLEIFNQDQLIISVKRNGKKKQLTISRESLID